MRGPAYAGIGPAVQLLAPDSGEPALGSSSTFNGQAMMSGLTPGKAYKLLKLTDLAAVPASATALPIGGAVQTIPFTPTGATHTLAVSWQSDVPAWFICVAA